MESPYIEMVRACFMQMTYLINIQRGKEQIHVRMHVLGIRHTNFREMFECAYKYTIIYAIIND